MRICFLGESFVNGTGDPACLGWPGRICAHAIAQGHDITHYNLGIRGETSSALLDRAPRELPLRLPEDCDGRVIYSFGTNDMTWHDDATRVSVAASLQNLEALLAWTQPRYPVLVVSPCPVDDVAHVDRLVALVEQMAIVCQQRQVPFLDVLTPLQQNAVWLTEAKAYDGAHPRAAGYQALAALVEAWEAWQTWFPSGGELL
ncbi:lipase [filamentous cyanobacterium LEGE 11480]|uniref:Lipase n=1 Tax=Romeriopsis navalis LEGE 11480 TaxID=2777977 RepID=A0A928Z4B8_9CYAN|nr:GDSL-type esterase/lipase family protein [Romeriopsis navalis]MBE9030095.1 lipase [Romeriopsis navalis LEGE 11480]